MSNHTAFWKPERRRRWTRGVLLVTFLYLLTVAGVYLAQDRLAFPGWSSRRAMGSPPADAAVEQTSIRAADGNSIEAWWLPSPGWTPAQGAVIYLHGNGENLSDCGRTLVRWRDELETGALGLDYPGFGRSTGVPGEKSCCAAAQAALDWLVREKGVSLRQVVVVGQSMGGAMAIDLVSHQRCRLLVTSGTFTSFPAAAQDQYGWLPAGFLARLRFDNISKIRTVETPAFTAHGTDDHVVPYAHGEALYAAAREPKRFFGIPGHHHAQPKTKEFFAAVREFLRKTDELENSLARASLNSEAKVGN